MPVADGLLLRRCPNISARDSYSASELIRFQSAVTSFGGLLFMLLAAGFIAAVVVLEAGPVYQLFMADFHGRSLSGLQWAWLIVSFAIVLILCFLAVLLPMRLGERRLRG